MSWFIFSEVMFFAAFFGALFYARAITMPWLGEPDAKALLWPEFSAVWPNLGPAGTIEQFQTIGPWLHPDDQHLAAAYLGRNPHYFASCAACL